MAKKKSSRETAKKERPVSLEYKFKNGESLRYTAKVVSEQLLEDGGKVVGRQSYEATLVVLEKAFVMPGGDIELEMTIESAYVTMEGARKTLPSQGKTLTLEMTKRGEIIRSDSDVPLSQVPFPDMPVTTGSRWEGRSFFPVPEKDKPHSVVFLYTLGGSRKEGGYDCVELNVQALDNSLALADDLNHTMDIEGTSFFAPREGKLISSHVTTKMGLKSSDSSISSTFDIGISLTEVVSPGRSA